MLLKGAWEMVKPFIDEKTRNKIQILDKKYMNKLLEHVYYFLIIRLKKRTFLHFLLIVIILLISHDLSITLEFGIQMENRTYYYYII